MPTEGGKPLVQGSKFQVQSPPPTSPRGSLVTPQAGRLIWKFQVPGSRFNAAHRRRQAAGSRFKVPGSKFKAAHIRRQAAGSRFKVPGSKFKVAHRRRQAAGSRFQVPGSKFKRRSIVYTPTLPHSYTPKKLLTYHLSLFTFHLDNLFTFHLDNLLTCHSSSGSTWTATWVSGP